MGRIPSVAVRSITLSQVTLVPNVGGPDVGKPVRLVALMAEAIAIDLAVQRATHDVAHLFGH